MKVLSGSRGLVMQSVDDDVLIVASGRVSSVSYTAGREFRVCERFVLVTTRSVQR